MNIEELFENELYHSYGLLTTDDANLSINYLKTEVMEYVAGLEKRIAELEAQAPKVVKPQILPVLDRKCECGAALDYGVNYCNNCGAKLVWRDA